MEKSNFFSFPDLVRRLRFLVHLPAYLRNPLTIPEARAILRRRLEQREEDFLNLIKFAVLGNPTNPYRALLQQAGCEYGDIDLLVKKEGLEGGLLELFHAGVYLTMDEYKGRRPVVRGSTTIAATPRLLRNPLVIPQFYSKTSGSRGVATPIPMDLACIRDRAVNMFLSLNTRGGSGWRNAVWMMSGIAPLLWYSACAGPADRWFTNIDPKTSSSSRQHRWKNIAFTWTGRLARAAIPSLEYVPVDAPFPVAFWMEQTLRAGKIPHLFTYLSTAVRLCQAAEEAGLDLAGAQFTVTGEPVTEVQLAAIRRVNAHAVPDYGSADSGGSASGGCLSPEAPDDVHVFSDLNALIQADAPPFPRGALLLSSIRPTAPFIFLNISMGDCATLTDRKCGCPMEALGWRTHLHTIRSFEKLTVAGITFMDTDVVRILEEVLPHRFGGGPSDYQLVEGVMDGERPRLRLLVHPIIGPVDSTTVSAVFLDALGAGSETEQLMAHRLREERLLEVERKAPYMTASGKILHLWAASSSQPGEPE